MPKVAIWVEIIPPAGACAVSGNGDTLDVAVNALPTAPLVTVTGSKLQVIPTVLGASYQWQQRNAATSSWEDIPGAMATTYIAMKTGKYRVSIVTDKGCGPVYSTERTVIGNGLHYLNTGKPISIHPNPTAGIVTIEGLVAGMEIELTLRDMLGRTVYTVNQQVHNQTITEADLSALSNGCYIMSIKSKEDMRIYYQTKLIKSGE